MTSKCAYCGIELQNRNDVINDRKHVNIEQVPRWHFFCSKKCKLNWCYNGGKGRKRIKA